MADDNSNKNPHKLAGSTRTDDRDPYIAFRFVVRIDRPIDSPSLPPNGAGMGATTTSQNQGAGSAADPILAGFTDISGLGVETEVMSFRAGGVNTFDMQLAGAAKFSSRLVLKRGLTRDSTIWNWYRKVLNGEIERRNMTIAVNSIKGVAGPSWTFVDACPVKWTGPELHAATSAIAFESIELVHRGLLLH
jgi:phage tail-like protein